MTPNELEIAAQYLEEQEEKRGCCMPYDCMHHELCYEDGKNACYQCKHLESLLDQVRHLTPADWELAENDLKRQRDNAFAYRMGIARELESIGDYLGADRVLGMGEEEEW